MFHSMCYFGRFHRIPIIIQCYGCFFRWNSHYRNAIDSLECRNGQYLHIERPFRMKVPKIPPPFHFCRAMRSNNEGSNLRIEGQFCLMSSSYGYSQIVWTFNSICKKRILSEFRQILTISKGKWYLRMRCCCAKCFCCYCTSKLLEATTRIFTIKLK